LLGVAGCSEEARAHRGLKKVVHREIGQFNKYHQREVKPNVYESGGRFYRIYHERVDPLSNVRRTNSLDTPYIATLNFTEHVYLTKKHASMKECRTDSHFILSNTTKREIVYAFVNGSWKRKEVY
ncbi:MAG: hypothetical protein C4532_05390, partial [Candidatus Abyssobacteria bacterium SURF_17]